MRINRRVEREGTQVLGQFGPHNRRWKRFWVSSILRKYRLNINFWSNTNPRENIESPNRQPSITVWAALGYHCMLAYAILRGQWKVTFRSHIQAQVYKPYCSLPESSSTLTKNYEEEIKKLPLSMFRDSLRTFLKRCSKYLELHMVNSFSFYCSMPFFTLKLPDEKIVLISLLR